MTDYLHFFDRIYMIYRIRFTLLNLFNPVNPVDPVYKKGLIPGSGSVLPITDDRLLVFPYSTFTGALRTNSIRVPALMAI